jgi:hypothetical protein
MSDRREFLQLVGGAAAASEVRAEAIRKPNFVLAGMGHFQDVNVPIGRHPKPWGDWDSTLGGPQ